MKEPKAWGGIAWGVTLVVPFVLLMTAIRLLMTPLFVDLAYAAPGFPEDAYGFTSTQRRAYAKIALEYILNDEGISFLGGQRLEDGAPMYNERELSHMVDVKVLTQAVLETWYFLLALLVGLGAAAWYFGRWDILLRGLARGGLLTVVLIVTILIFVFLTFSALFTGFHKIFFEGDTWIFYYSDTLIRLFPLPFWQNVFIALGGMALLGGGALWWLGRKKASDKEKTGEE